MKTENLNKANELQSQIGLLEEKIKNFNPKHKWVYLHITDHYGNASHTIETYAFSTKYSESAGRELEEYIPQKYGEFLDSVKEEMQKRIDFLKSEFDKI
jgi:hypothetical protein